MKEEEGSAQGHCSKNYSLWDGFLEVSSLFSSKGYLLTSSHGHGL